MPGNVMALPTEEGGFELIDAALETRHELHAYLKIGNGC